MEDILTRKIINNDIIFKDASVFNLHEKDKIYTFTELSKKIDCIKNILQHEYNCVEGQTVLIGITPCMLQIAAFFACTELGLTVVIADYSRNDNWIDPNYVDPKTQSLLPIDYFIVSGNNTQIPKHKLFSKICNTVVNIKDFDNINYVRNDTIIATGNSIALKCTSSGTTGTAKVIKHTHEFLYKLIQRNKNLFYGNVCMAHNLNHGSSPATYFLPSLCSPDTKTFVSYMITYIIKGVYDEQRHKIAFEKFKNFHFDHLMIPYTFLIDNFLVDSCYPNLNLYTLSTIKKDWITYYRNNKIKNIISIFGSNETSGPVFTNEIIDPSFEENKYKPVDDFYKINLLDDSLLEVSMPVYGTKIITNDLFDKVDDNYYHQGRKDLYRVNGVEVNIAQCNRIIKEQLDADLIVDTVKDSLYIAVWSDQQYDNQLNDILFKIKKDSNGVHNISKTCILNKDNFLTGIKLDMELLRDYFRNFV